MFDPILESLRKATEMNIQSQQEMLRKWVDLWPMPMAMPGNMPDQVQKYQKKWAEMVEATVTKQREILETQFSAGMKNLELAFSMAEAKDAAQLRNKATELWQKTFDCLRQTFEAQVRSYQALADKWTELVSKNPA